MIDVPMFSVLIPAYNAGAFLEECLASLDAQSFRDFEVVIVDDGSTDGTGALCDAWASARPYATVVHKDNEGLLLARRSALPVARGEYAIFLDADDALRGDALLKVAGVATDTAAEVIAFGMSSSPDYSHPQFCSDFPFNTAAEQGGRVARKAALRGRFNTMCGKAFSLAGLDVDADYRRWGGLMHGEDLFQLLPALDGVERAVHMPEALYFYRRHDGASTMSYKTRQADDVFAVAERLIEYGDRWGMPDDAAYGALRNFCSTAKILVGDRAARDVRAGELDRMAGFLRILGLDDAGLISAQRFDERLLLRAILGGRHKEAAGIIGLVECMKKARARL